MTRRRWGAWAKLVALVLTAAGGLRCGDSTPSVSDSDQGLAEVRRHTDAARLLDRATITPVKTDSGGFTIAARATAAHARGLVADPSALAALGERGSMGVHAELPATAAEPFSVGPRNGAESVRVRRRGATAASAELVENALLYPEALPGADAIVFGVDGTLEELLVVREPGMSVSYDLELPAGATLHQVERGVVELLNSEGEAWLRLRAERAWDASGQALAVSASASGSSIEVRVAEDAVLPVVIDPDWESTGAMSAVRENATATLLPSGRVLVAGGYAPATGYISSSEMYDPQTGRFTAAGSMQKSRIYHTATLLRTGKVLVTGGLSTSGGVHNAAELFDEQTRLFTSVTATMSSARSHHTATLLQSGQVLIAGGTSGTESVATNTLSTAELFDPSNNTFTLASGPLVARRYAHTATRLSDGKVVLLAGSESSSTFLSSAEVFDPTSKTFAAAGSLLLWRVRHTATLLPSGEILVSGGYGLCNTTTYETCATAGVKAWSNAELYDPGSTSSTPTGSMAVERRWHAATLLSTGKVLVGGGEDNSGVMHTTAELYDPSRGVFDPTVPMAVARRNFTATLLESGKVLYAGGPSIAAVDVYDPLGGGGFGAFTATTGGLSGGRQWAAATLLPSGKVLVAGGEVSGVPVSTAELYDPSAGTFASTGSMQQPRSNLKATLLANGNVLITGGTGASGVVQNTSELYDPTGETFTLGANMTTARMAHTSTLLSSGEVLIAGGFGSGFAIQSSAELYDPSTASFRAVPTSMSIGRASHTATLLQSGKVLIASGAASSPTADLFVRSAGPSGAFVATGSLSRVRLGHTATLMPSGKVLVVGGEDGPARLSTAEYYDPNAAGGVGAFTLTGSLASARSAHTATMLPNGKVLVVGGQGATANLSTAEIFDPGDGSTGEFKAAGAMGTVRTGHVASLLPDGKVLVASGAPAASALSTAELWNQPAIGDEAWRPVLSTVPTTVTAGQSASISGSGLTGISEASFGGPASSATSYPIAVWMPSAGGWGTMGRMLDFTATSTTWEVPPTALAGPGWLFAVTNAIPSHGMPVTLAPSAIATACSVHGECQSGFCVSGFCCDRICDGPCEACSAALKASGADGICGPVKSGTDPNDACPAEPQATCQRTGVCDGLGACQRWAAGTVCLAGSCSGFVLSPAFTCDGNGTCQPSTAVDCRPGRCDSTTKQCVMTCTTNSDCSSGSFCRAGTCLAPQPEGAICAAPTECISGYCVDGVCCSTRCDALCQACTSAKKGGGDDGTCGNIADGFDPDSECTETAASTCQTDGMCDGTGKCRLWSGSTPCGQTSCVDGSGAGDRSKAGGQFCDGLGTCTVKSGLECGLFKCAGDVCGTSCTSLAECLSAAYCDLATTPGTCKEKSLTGASCSTSEQCSSGFCVDGVCCNSPCQGQCEACNETEPGQCVAVTGAPRGERVPCAGDGTECDGACDGDNRSACAYGDVETLCGEQTCIDDGHAARRVCDGRGACRAPVDTSCVGFLCVDGACNTTCSTDAECAATYRCDTTQTPVACVPKGRGDCIDNDTVLKSPDGTLVPCAPFKCDPSEGLCLTSCRSKADCTDGNECSSKGLCEAPFDVPSEDSSCACRAAGSSPTSNANWGIAALLFALGLRRRRAMRAGRISAS